MSLIPFYTTKFKKDIKSIKKNCSSKDTVLIKDIMHKLINQEKLDLKYKAHPLIGQYKNRMECHIKPDLLLIYKIEEKEGSILFERIGSHSELFN